MKSRIGILALLTAMAGCGGSNNGSDAGMQPQGDSGPVVPGVDTGVPQPDTGVPTPDTGTPTTGLHCTTGTLFSGHPNTDADPGVHATEGDPLAGIDGHPLGWRDLAFSGTHVVTIVGEEVWSTDLSVASPVVHRVAGLDSSTQTLIHGACASARFANLQDVEAAADGSIFVMDQTADAVLHITHPFDATMCNVEFYAGTSVDTTDINPDNPANPGHTNGPGASAQFALPGRMAIDSTGNLYVWDDHNAQIRKIANDAAHTVSDFAPATAGGQDWIVDGMTVMGDSLYGYGHDTAGDVFLERWTLATGALTEIFRGRASLFGWDSSDSLEMGGITNDGTDLIAYFKGGIYSVTTAGRITQIAGDPDAAATFEFGSGYDETMSHPAAMLQLPTSTSQYATAGEEAWLQLDGAGHLYFVGEVADPYVERIDCSR